MDLERFERLVDAYGGDEAAWPADEREAARALSSAEPRARALRAAARALDRELDNFPVAPPPSIARILAARPRPGPVARLLAWLVPRSPPQLWRPALAAALPLALGLFLGAGLWPPPAANGWEQQERALLATPATGDTP